MVRSMDRKNYYKGLDILRIFSCFAVFLYHLGLLKGGYLAVCIFFVLTGFLSCYSAFSKDKFSILEYYKKRFLSIYVPLLLTVFISIGVISFIPNINWLNLKTETLSVLLGYNNYWQLNANLDYFARHVNSPFMHFWYIAILMQFEIIFPLIMKLIKSVQKKVHSTLISLILGIVSLLSCGYFVYKSVSSDIMIVYYDTFSRMFSILFGVLLGFIFSNYKNNPIRLLDKGNYPTIIICIYYAILLGLFLFVDANHSLFAVSMILTSLIACRLIQYSTINQSTDSSRFDKVIQEISGFSYEFYLVQYPIIFLYQYIEVASWIKIICIFITTIIVSYLLHFALKVVKKKPNISSIICFSLISIFSCYGVFCFLTSPDHTKEMKELENQLSLNEELLLSRQKDYLSRMKEQENSWNTALQEVEENEEQLESYVHDFPAVFVGDSIMLGALNELYEQFPNGYFDAKKSRTDWEANRILLSIKNQNLLSDVIVINLGANGQCGAPCRQEILRTCEDRNIFWLNVTNDRDVHVNNGLNQFSEENENVTILDWNGFSSGHPEYFVADGIHLTEYGSKVYSQFVYDSIYQFFNDSIQKKKDEILKEKSDSLEKKIVFYGNEILLGSYPKLQEEFSDYDVEFHTNIEKDWNIDISQVKKLQKEKLLPKNLIFVVDNDFVIDNSMEKELSSIAKDTNITVVLFQKSSLSNEDITIIDLSDEVRKHPEYWMIDKIHLSDVGVNSFIETLNNTIKNSN